jgi:hypothetical protein
MSYPKEGVVSFSITDGMPLTGIYQYVPNPNGPVITAKQGYLEVSRSPQSVANQWTFFSIDVPKPVTAAGGLIFQFDVSYATVQPPTEVKLTLAADVILRYDGSTFNYVYWNNAFFEIGKSAIKVDGKTHQVTLCFSPSAIVIFEDGLFIANWAHAVTSPIVPIFNWQILNAGSSLSAKLSNILIIPPTFEQIVQTPWDIVLTSKWSYPSDIWVVTETAGNPLPVTYEPTYMRVATDSLKTRNSWVYPAVVMPLVKPTGIITYSMRVNASGGSESKITIIGDNILRITDNGKTVLWTLYDANGQFQTLAKSSIVVGSANFTEVTVIYSSNTISLLENGVYLYTRQYSTSQAWSAVWWVQHLDVGTAISTDISNVRCLPLAMSFPPLGTYNIYNFKFSDRVVDLFGSEVTGPLIGFPLNQPLTLNQKWNLARVTGFSDKNSFGLQNLVSTTCFASAPETVAGGPLFGSTREEVFSIVPISGLGVWSINIPGPSNLSVRLPSEAGETPIILFGTNEGDDAQKWQLVRTPLA